MFLFSLACILSEPPAGQLCRSHLNPTAGEKGVFSGKSTMPWDSR